MKLQNSLSVNDSMVEHIFYVWLFRKAQASRTRIRNLPTELLGEVVGEQGGKEERVDGKRR